MRSFGSARSSGRASQLKKKSHGWWFRGLGFLGVFRGFRGFRGLGFLGVLGVLGFFRGF